MKLAVLALLASLCNAAAWAQPPASNAPQTQQTVPVKRGARLVVNNDTGRVVVRAWDRDAVRVEARHSTGTRVSVRSGPTGVSIDSSGTRGPAGSVQYDISVPSWMPVSIDGYRTSIVIEGTQSEVSAETVRGDVTIKGGSGFISGISVGGEVVVEAARGRVTVNSVNQGVTVTGTTGDIVAETVNGSIKLTAITSDTVSAETINGHITFDGVPAAGGKYRFSTHNGNIFLVIPENASATFAVRTYNGTLNTNLALAVNGNVGRGRRATYRLGGGSAEFDLESFGGTIHLRKPGAPPAPTKGKN